MSGARRNMFPLEATRMQATRALRHLNPRRAYSSAPFDREAYLSRAKLLLDPGNKKTFLYDAMAPTPSHLLNTSLAGHIPLEAHHPASFREHLLKARSSPPPHHRTIRMPQNRQPLPLGHLLVYFGPQAYPSELMPDGTVAEHCPGAPFTRRMWAGGTLRFAPAGRESDVNAQLALDGRLALCVESIASDPVIRGAEGDEKVFVQLTRKYLLRRTGNNRARREKNLRAQAETNPDIEETRTLVFMRERGGEDAVQHGGGAAEKEKERDMTRLNRLKKDWTPTYSFSLTPDRLLLFHFSALTHNAHAIHLDPRYAQEVEGHRDCLVHGPLSLSLVLMAVQAQADRIASEEDVMRMAVQALAKVDGAEKEKAVAGVQKLTLAELSYRNLAPLYVGEEMKVCVRVREAGGTTWDVWVEGPDGSFAVKGTAEMRRVGFGGSATGGGERLQGRDMS